MTIEDDGLNRIEMSTIRQIIEELKGRRGDTRHGPKNLAPEPMTLSDQLRQHNHWIGTKRLSLLMGCSVEDLYRLIQFYGLPADKPLSRWKFFGPAVESWIDNRNAFSRNKRTTPKCDRAPKSVRRARKAV